MIIIPTMDITEDNSVYEDDPVKVIYLMLEDPAVEPSLFPVMMDPESVLVGHSDEVRS